MDAELEQLHCREDFQLLLNKVLSDTLPVWKIHNGIVPFGIGLGLNDEIVYFGGPEVVTPGVIGIKEWVIKRITENKDFYRAIVYIQLCERQKQDFVQAELMHMSGTALRTFYLLPHAENWLVEQIINTVW